MSDQDNPDKQSAQDISSSDDDNEMPWLEKKHGLTSRETAVLSKNNSGLRRYLRGQADKDGEESDTAQLGDSREVLLIIRGVVERLLISEDSAYKLGRFDIGTKRFDEIDLSPYGALDRGVSRTHAQLHLEGEHLFITDLGSTNGTYVGGERLAARKPHQLRKGDELLLGRLAIQVMFR